MSLLGILIVITFANMAMEIIILVIMSPRIRLLLLGNKHAIAALWAVMLIANLWLHGRGVSGPTASYLGAIAMYPLAHAVLPKIFGKLWYDETDQLQYTAGRLKYWANELMNEDEYTAYIIALGRGNRDAFEEAEYRHYLAMQQPTKQSFRR